MLVLGWHGGIRAGEADDALGGYSAHDGAAVAVRDGAVVAAIEEERLNRVKHSNFFPARSIRFCLERAGATLADVDLVSLDAHEAVVDEFATFCALVDPAEPLVTGRELVGRLFEREFGVDVRAKLHFCRHHLAHLHGAIHASGQARGLAVALDGEGDHLSGMAATFDGARITPLVEYSAAQSLGSFYTAAIALLGYRRFDEYKVMGLAPYGNPARYRPLFERFYTLLPEGPVRDRPRRREAGAHRRARPARPNCGARENPSATCTRTLPPPSRRPWSASPCTSLRTRRAPRASARSPTRGVSRTTAR